MNAFKTLGLALMGAVLLGGCATQPAKTAAGTKAPPRLGSGTPVFHDEQIKTALIEAGVKLLENGEAVAMDVLQSQLKRTHCSLALPEHSRRKRSVEDVGERGRESVVIVGSLFKCGKCNSWHLDTGTGFILTQSGAIATCYHVANCPTHKSLIIMTSNGRIYPVKEVLAADETNDIAILRIEGLQLRPVALSTEARIGSRVFVIGHPEQKFYTLSEGIVSRYFTGQEETGDATMMSITADFGLGSSGCPVFNESGAVVGMADNIVSTVSEMKDGKSKAGIVFKNCRPAEAILNLIRSPHLGAKPNAEAQARWVRR